MTNEHCIMKLNQLIESRQRLQAEMRHKGTHSWVIEQDIVALQHAIEQLTIFNILNQKEVDKVS